MRIAMRHNIEPVKQTRKTTVYYEKRWNQRDQDQEGCTREKDNCEKE